MAQKTDHDELLREVLDAVIENNRQTRPGSPLAELKSAIESAIGSLPPLDFDEYTKAIDDPEAAERFLQHAPELVGWDADQIVDWIEELSKKL